MKIERFYNTNLIVYLILGLIVLFALIIRVYQIDIIPPSLTWDEAAVGYNAYTIANWGKDEYGKSFPLYFKSFGEDKQPIHIYITAIFVKLFGLSEFSTRISVAIFGALNVLIIFFLVKILFKSNLIALLSSLFLAISPQNIFFSRFNHESNFALFFFMLGLLLFYTYLNKKRLFLTFSFCSFLISSISYHAAEIIIPLIVVVLGTLYFRDIIKDKFNIITIFLIFTGFIIISLLNPQLLGIVRYNQTIQGNSDIEKTELFVKTHNYFLGRVNLAFNQYLLHFTSKYLFEAGDKNPRLSAQKGEFYKFDAILLLIGVGYLISKKTKVGILVLFWGILGPLPSALFAEAPHAGRATFMMGSWQIIASLGFYTIINLFKKAHWKLLVSLILIIILLISMINYLKFYFNEFPKKYAVDWQYGMKQIVEYVNNSKEFSQVYNTSIRAQPYIFYLYFLKYPLPDYLQTVLVNNLSDKDYNNIASFDRYYFTGWDAIKDGALAKVLYILTPSEYDGLVSRSNFEIKKVIYYPNGGTAFFIVALK